MRIDLKIDAVAKRIHAEIKASGTTLTRVYGIGPINAALIIGEVVTCHGSRHATTSPATPAPHPSLRHPATTTGTD